MNETDHYLVEECVSSAVASALIDGYVIHPSKYEYKFANGDLDGLVIGSWGGKEVVVLCKAKHNMDNNTAKARKELFASHKYWNELVTLDESNPNIDADMLEDYRALDIAANKGKVVMLAFGGFKFSQQIAKSKFGDIKTPWFMVVASADGCFNANFIDVAGSHNSDF